MPRKSTALVRYDRSRAVTPGELEARRVVKAKMTLVDEAERLHKTALEHSDPVKRDLYIKYNNADWDDEAIEGTVPDDRLLAAQIVREIAEGEKNKLVMGTKLRRLAQALNAARGRFHESTNQRRKARLDGPEPGAAISDDKFRGEGFTAKQPFTGQSDFTTWPMDERSDDAAA